MSPIDPDVTADRRLGVSTLRPYPRPARTQTCSSPPPPAGGAVRTLRRVHPTGWGTGGLKTRPGRRVRIDIIYVALWTTCRPRPRQICLLFSFFPSARSQGVGTETENHRSRRVTRIEFVRNRLATGPKLLVCGPGVSCSRVHCRAWRRAKRPESSFAFRFCGC